METKDLDRFIETNRDEFDLFEPSASVWENIQKKQEEELNTPTKVISIKWKLIVGRAAAVVAIFLTSFFSHDYIVSFFENNENIAQSEAIEIDNNESTPQVVKDFEETQSYYGYQVSNKLVEIEKYAEKYPDIIEDIKEEIIELDNEFDNLAGDLNENVNNEDVIRAMIENYRIKLQILEGVMQTLKENESYHQKEKSKEL